MSSTCFASSAIPRHSDRNSLISNNLPLVDGVVNCLLGRLKVNSLRGLDRDDLTQEGRIGLIQAADNYDPSRGAQFSTFALPRIMGAIKNAVHGQRNIEEQIEDATLQTLLTTAPTNEAATDTCLAVQQALSQLSEQQRQVVTLYYLRYQTQAQIAAQLGVSQPYVSGLLAEGRDKLRALLADTL